MSQQNEEPKRVVQDSYFVVDNTGAFSLIYSDTSINSKFQFICKDELKKSSVDNDSEDNEEEHLPNFV